MPRGRDHCHVTSGHDEWESRCHVTTVDVSWSNCHVVSEDLAHHIPHVLGTSTDNSRTHFGVSGWLREHNSQSCFHHGQPCCRAHRNTARRPRIAADARVMQREALCKDKSCSDRRLECEHSSADRSHIMYPKTFVEGQNVKCARVDYNVAHTGRELFTLYTL